MPGLFLPDLMRETVHKGADHLCGARKYEQTEGREDTRAGSYDRQLHTRAGEVTLQIPKLRSLPFETAIIERYRRRETSVEEVLTRCTCPETASSHL